MNQYYKDTGKIAHNLYHKNGEYFDDWFEDVGMSGYGVKQAVEYAFKIGSGTTPVHPSIAKTVMSQIE
ncbi:MAG: hypothetical protein H6767_09950 [Candidatus Peribacteria bacterium]|nr:MAG: hypothetical protein H6767_09950 [Candidatus Peribacteria bacterium]